MSTGHEQEALRLFASALCLRSPPKVFEFMIGRVVSLYRDDVTFELSNALSFCSLWCVLSTAVLRSIRICPAPCSSRCDAHRSVFPTDFIVGLPGLSTRLIAHALELHPRLLRLSGLLCSPGPIHCAALQTALAAAQRGCV